MDSNSYEAGKSDQQPIKTWLVVLHYCYCNCIDSVGTISAQYAKGISGLQAVLEDQQKKSKAQ